MTDETFAGFPVPTKNFFSMPNEMIDIIAQIDNLAELKVIIYVIRHTWGYQEYGITKTITTEEFMHGRKRHDGTRIDNGTGLKSDRSVKDGIKQALKHGYLICEVDATDLARIKKSYALRMASTEGYNLPPDARRVDTTPLNDENRQVVSTPQTGSIYPSEVQNLPIGGAKSTHRSEKDTIERHLEKNTLEKQESIAPASLSETDSHSHTGYTKEPYPLSEHPKRQTDEHKAITQEMLAEKVIAPKITLPSRQKPIDPSPSAAAVQPPFSVSSSSSAAPQAASGQELPAMALTAKQIAKQNEKRAKDIWTIVERELETKFTRTQRASDYNTKGMENLIEDEVSDETLTTALKKLPSFYIPQFNLKKFHEMIPGLTSTRDAPQHGPPSPDVIIRPAGTVRSFNGIAKRAAGQ